VVGDAGSAGREWISTHEELSPEWARILFPPERQEYELVYHNPLWVNDPATTAPQSGKPCGDLLQWGSGEFC